MTDHEREGATALAESLHAHLLAWIAAHEQDPELQQILARGTMLFAAKCCRAIMARNSDPPQARQDILAYLRNATEPVSARDQARLARIERLSREQLDTVLARYPIEVGAQDSTADRRATLKAAYMAGEIDTLDLWSDDTVINN